MQKEAGINPTSRKGFSIKCFLSTCREAIICNFNYFKTVIHLHKLSVCQEVLPILLINVPHHKPTAVCLHAVLSINRSDFTVLIVRDDIYLHTSVIKLTSFDYNQIIFFIIRHVNRIRRNAVAIILFQKSLIFFPYRIVIKSFPKRNSQHNNSNYDQQRNNCRHFVLQNQCKLFSLCSSYLIFTKTILTLSFPPFSSAAFINLSPATEFS